MSLTSQNDILNTDIAGSVTTLNGFTASSGVANFNGLGEIVGKAAVLTSSFIRFTITMDPQSLEYPPEPDGDVGKVLSYALPHDFRVLIVRAKRQNSVDTSVALSTNSELNEPALRTNLFIDENILKRIKDTDAIPPMVDTTQEKIRSVLCSLG